MAYTTTTELLDDGMTRVVTFSGLTTGDTTDAIDVSRYSYRSYVPSGTAGGASVKLQASNDLTNWVNKTTFSIGTPVTDTGIALRSIRVAVTGGSGTNVTVSILMALPYPSRI